MRQELLTYYERELSFLRLMGAEFAQKYPKIASRLLLEPDRCEDPHVERMLEAFAFLAARVHLRVDDDFPQITTTLLDVIYPHFVRPLPSMSVVQFHPDPEQGKLASGLHVPRNSMLYSREVEGVPCKFSSCYETTLWPIAVKDVTWRTPDLLVPAVKAPDAVAAICMKLECDRDVTFSKLEMKSLRFYLNGEPNIVHTLYELLCNNCSQILLRDPLKIRKDVIQIPKTKLRAVGFEEEESLLPYPPRSFPGYRLLQEYFSFPEKFLFIELGGLEALRNFESSVEIVFLISKFERKERAQQLEVGVTGETFRLGCTPVVNLFAKTAEPILLDQTRYEYPVIPDVRRQHAMEIFCIDEVTGTTPLSREQIRYEPFYSARHKSPGAQSEDSGFWQATRRSAGIHEDERTDLFLTVVDRSGRLLHPQSDTLTVRCMCTNFTLPAKLPFGYGATDLELEGSSAIPRIMVLRKPSPTLRPPSGKGTLWRLISHMSLNYLSLVEGGAEALKQILELYDFSDSRYLRSQITGIRNVKSAPQLARISTEYGVTTARGTHVDIDFDEEQFVGGGVFLFASVLERFLASYVSMNSFSQLTAHTLQRKEILREWLPRSGAVILM